MTTKGRGRPTVATDRKKSNYTVILRPGEAKDLINRYGSLTLAIRSVIVQDKPELLPLIKQIAELSEKLKSLLH